MPGTDAPSNSERITSRGSTWEELFQEMERRSISDTGLAELGGMRWSGELSQIIDVLTLFVDEKYMTALGHLQNFVSMGTLCRRIAKE
jgi:hypothetical protein